LSSLYLPSHANLTTTIQITPNPCRVSVQSVVFVLHAIPFALLGHVLLLVRDGPACARLAERRAGCWVTSRVIVKLFPFILNTNNVDNGGSSLAVQTQPIIPVAPHFLSLVIAVSVVTDFKFHDSSRKRSYLGHKPSQWKF
jgi:hypothetical protein